MLQRFSAGLFGLAILLIAGTASAQTQLDRIRQELSQIDNGREKVLRMISASRELTSSNTNAALSYARQAITIADQQNLSRERSQALSNLGILYFTLNQHDRARQQLEQTIAWRNRNFSNDLRAYAENARDHRYIGSSYEKEGHWQPAYEAYLGAADQANKANSPEEEAYAHNRMGEVQIRLENYQRALNHFNAALPLAKQANNRSLRRTIEKNIGSSYALLQAYLDKQQVQMEVEEIQDRIGIVRDSLIEQQESNQVLITEKNLLEMRQQQKDAELRAHQAEIERQQAALESQKARERTLWIGGILAGALALTIIIALVNRSRTRKHNALKLAREKRKSEDLLYNILPSDIARELIDYKAVIPREYEEVSILFTDFKGFTRIAAKLSPDQLVNELNHVFQAFDKIVEQYGLEKIKTIGDAYMAVAGVPNPHPDHAFATVSAALDMQRFMHEWKVQKEMRGEEPWELRIGINSGKVVAGVIGNKKFAYDVWGDAVNTASRMETAGEAWEVNISADTFRLIEGRASCLARGPLPVKNKGSMNMYFVKHLIAQKPELKPVTDAPTPWWRR